MAGRVAAFFIRERLQIAELIKLVTCPCLIIHGRKDELVPWQHSHEIFKQAAGPASLMLSDEMTHDSFDFVQDLSEPIYFFLARALTTRKGHTLFQSNQIFNEQQRRESLRAQLTPLHQHDIPDPGHLASQNDLND